MSCGRWEKTRTDPGSHANQCKRKGVVFDHPLLLLRKSRLSACQRQRQRDNGVGVAVGGTPVVGEAVTVAVAVGEPPRPRRGVAVAVADGGWVGVVVALALGVGVGVRGVAVAVGLGEGDGGVLLPLSSTSPKFVTQYQLYGDPGTWTRAMPMTRYELLSMFALCPLEFRHASKASCAVSQAVPAAMFSPAPPA